MLHLQGGCSLQQSLHRTVLPAGSLGKGQKMSTFCCLNTLWILPTFLHRFFFKGFGKAARLRNRLNRSEISQTCVSSCGFYASIPSTFCPFFSDFPGSRGGLLYVQMVHQDRENITSTGLAAFGGLSFVISGKDDACHPLRATWWMHLNSGKVPKRLQSDLTSVEGFHHVWWFDTQVEGLLGETPGWRCFRTFADLQRS